MKKMNKDNIIPFFLSVTDSDKKILDFPQTHVISSTSTYAQIIF